MIDIERLKENIERNTNLWISIWLLILLNFSVLFYLSHQISIVLILLLLLLAVSGSYFLKNIRSSSNMAFDVLIKEQENVHELMEEIIPHCDEIFNREIEKISNPVLKNFHKESNKGLEWLWEDTEEFLTKLDRKVNENRNTLRLMSIINDEKQRIIDRIENNTVLILSQIHEAERIKIRNIGQLEKKLKGQSEILKMEFQKEKQSFYDYVNSQLMEKTKESEENINIREYFNVYKLGEHFSNIIEKLTEARLHEFEELLINELEQFSADVIGQMQKITAKVYHNLKEMESDIFKLINECKSDGGLFSKRLNELLKKVAEDRGTAGEILVTLAWQDILLEKRWDDMKAKLLLTKDKVILMLEKEVSVYIEREFNGEHSLFVDALADDIEGAMVYRSLLDAEKIYNLYENNKLELSIEDPVYVLLQYLRPVELMVHKAISISEEGLIKRRVVRDEVKKEEKNLYFEKLLEEIKQKNSAYTPYLEGVYPASFYAFCNNPNISERPVNIKQAAWMIFMSTLENQEVQKELYLLIAYLLVIQIITEQYIHPLKSEPLPLKNNDEIILVREATFESIALLLSIEQKGMVSIHYLPKR